MREKFSNFLILFLSLYHFHLVLISLSHLTCNSYRGQSSNLFERNDFEWFRTSKMELMGLRYVRCNCQVRKMNLKMWKKECHTSLGVTRTLPLSIVKRVAFKAFAVVSLINLVVAGHKVAVLIAERFAHVTAGCGDTSHTVRELWKATESPVCVPLSRGISLLRHALLHRDRVNRKQKPAIHLSRLQLFRILLNSTPFPRCYTNECSVLFQTARGDRSLKKKTGKGEKFHD